MAGTALLLVGIGIALILSDDASDEPTGPVADALAAAVPAVDPFPELTETRVSIADDCLRVAIADERSERVQGLRGVVDLGPYDGMLFVADTASAGRFTMADTLIPLDIGFYAADGSEIDRLRMDPCPADEADCPTYGPDEAFLLALETPAGSLRAGSVASCV